MKTQKQADAGLSFSIIKTGDNSALEGLTYVGGSFRRKARLNYVAILVRHTKGTFLFDSGLGSTIDAQYRADMPWWKKQLLHYDHVVPAKEQLAGNGLSSIPRIFLSHGHWDHASGLVDFPNAEVWVTPKEKAFLDQIVASPKRFGPAVLRSQVAPTSIRWHVYELAPKPYLGFTHSYDIFGDESAMIVPLPGHTPGSVGLILRLSPSECIFFCSDTVWNVKALDRMQPKPWLARFVADQDQAVLQRTIRQVASIRAKHPEITFVPAHDANAQDPFGYFPAFYDTSAKLRPYLEK